jgi:thiamine transport system ATP-binding protein
VLTLKNVTVRFGTLAAVHDLSVEVADGERLAVLGPSGSGKSTLLRAIAGLEPLSAGEIRWDNTDLATVPVHRRGFGLMFQDYVLFPNRDVAHNVAFGLEMAGEPATAIATRVAEVLDLVGLAGYGSRAVTELSGGEQQRVALARALAPDPKLLMLDEPLGALDRSLRERLVGELVALFERLSLAIIYVTHDQDEALAVGNRVAVMRAGHVEQIARPRDLWLRPANEFVGRFLGLANIADATAAADGVADTPWGQFPVPRGTNPGDYRVCLRPDALRLDDRGFITGRVESSTFRGSRTVMTVAVDGAPSLEVHLPPSVPAPTVGAEISLAIDPEGVLMLPRRGSANLSE